MSTPFVQKNFPKNAMSDSKRRNIARRRPSLGRPLEERGNDEFDTPSIALNPLFAHEPLLWDVTHLDERFAGKGNLVIPMRSWGITVYASDISDRGCPNSTVQDFFQLRRPGRNSRVLLSNPPYSRAMDLIEHAFAIGFDVVIFLLKTGFLHPTTDTKGCTRPVTWSVSTFWRNVCRECMTPSTSQPVGKNRGRPKRIVGSFSTATTMVPPPPIRCHSTRRRRACRGACHEQTKTWWPSPA